MKAKRNRSLQAKCARKPVSAVTARAGRTVVRCLRSSLENRYANALSRNFSAASFNVQLRLVQRRKVTLWGASSITANSNVALASSISARHYRQQLRGCSVSNNALNPTAERLAPFGLRVLKAAAAG